MYKAATTAQSVQQTDCSSTAGTHHRSFPPPKHCD